MSSDQVLELVLCADSNVHRRAMELWQKVRSVSQSCGPRNLHNSQNTDTRSSLYLYLLQLLFHFDSRSAAPHSSQQPALLPTLTQKWKELHVLFTQKADKIIYKDNSFLGCNAVSLVSSSWYITGYSIYFHLHGPALGLLDTGDEGIVIFETSGTTHPTAQSQIPEHLNI